MPDEINENVNHEATKTENTAEAQVVREWVESEKYHQRKVYTAKGVGVVLGECGSQENGDPERLLVETLEDAEQHDVTFNSVRFKAVNDSYRDQYHIDKTVKTESGAYSISNGDDMAEALKGHLLAELQVIAKENGLQAKWDEWSGKGLNPGMRRMNLGNMLRNKAKKGEEITFFGKPVAEHMTIRGKELAEQAEAVKQEAEKAKAEREAKQAEARAAKEAAKKEAEAKAAAAKAEQATQTETAPAAEGKKKSKKKAEGEQPAA